MKKLHNLMARTVNTFMYCSTIGSQTLMEFHPFGSQTFMGFSQIGSQDFNRFQSNRTSQTLLPHTKLSSYTICIFK